MTEHTKQQVFAYFADVRSSLPGASVNLLIEAAIETFALTEAEASAAYREWMKQK